MPYTKKVPICFKNGCINAQAAENIWQKMRGLMGVKSLPTNEGMFFVFRREARRPFWMMGMRIPLDIVWLNSEMEIVEITKNQQPCNSLFCSAINPKHKSKYVLEINAGEADKLGLEVGDRAKSEEVLKPAG